MPRGFLIKRKKHHPESWFSRRGSEESEHFSASEYGSEPTRISPSVASNDSDEALNLSTKNNNNNVFSQGLDLSTSKSTSSSSSPSFTNSESDRTNEKTQHSAQTEEEEVNLNKVYLESSKKSQQKVDKDRAGKEEFNNNILPPSRHPLADFNRDSFQHYLPSSLPSSAPLSISTGSSWSPFYLTPFDHLSVASSPSGASSYGSSPRSAPAALPPPPPSPTVKPSSQQSASSSSSAGKKRPHPSTGAGHSKKANKRVKAVRKIEFNDSSSPVSGTYIREETDDGIRVVSGDIDTNLNIVEVTPEAQAEIAKIDNKIGEYRCRLCKDMYDTAFGLAQHRCSRIVHVEYRCPECDKVFNCSANLASHRRWHKPRQQPASGQTKLPLPKLLPQGVGEEDVKEAGQESGQFPCAQCGKQFKRQAYLRKHMATHNNSTSQPLAEAAAAAAAAASAEPCPLCGTLLTSEASRAKHMLQHAAAAAGERVKQTAAAAAAAAAGAGAIVCRLCGTQLADHLALEEHIRHRHQLPARTAPAADMFTCKLCSAACYNLSGLSEHVRKCHPATHSPLVMLQIPALSRPC